MSEKKDRQSFLVNGSSTQKENGKMRETGIRIIGAIPWGTHLCQFYETKEDLIDILVPYLKAGLEQNEFCMWITSEPLHVAEAKNALQKKVKNLDYYLKKGQIEILDSTEWYTKSGKFNADEVLKGWVSKEKQALDKGFNGLRLTGNTFWLEKKDWEDFTNYEEVINHVIGNYKMIAICSYSLDKCNTSEIIDVVSNHQFALIKRQGAWHRIESPEMKKSEQERERQAQLLNQVQDGVIRSDAMYHITYWNTGAERMYGYSETEALGKTTAELLRPIYSQGEREKIIDDLNRIGVSQARIRTRHRNGTEIIADVNSTRITDENGVITGYVVTYRDVTDREKAQAALKEAELKYRTVAENTYDFEFWLDPDGQYLYASPSCKRITGYTSKDFLADSSLRQKIIHPNDKQLFVDHVSLEVTKKKPGSLEFRIIHKDGSIKWIHHVCQPIYDENGKYLGVRGSNRDITERKQIEEALVKEHEELQTIFDSVPASIFYKDTENRLLRVNEAFTRLMELPKEELENKSLFNLYPKEQADAFWKDDKEVIASAKGKRNIIEPVQTKRGLLWVQTHKIPYRDNQGNITGVLGFTLDITDLKQAEEAFKKSEIRYRRLFETAKDGILLIDYNTGMIVDVNPYLINILDFSRDEFLKKHLWEIGPLRDIVPSKDYFLKLQKKGYTRYEDMPLQTKDGNKIDVEFVSNVYDVEGTKTIQCNIRNITERKKAEKELQETRDYLENLINYANAPIIVWDKDFTIVRFNHAFEHLTGYTSKMVIGKKLDLLFPKEGKEEALRKIQRTLRGEHWESVEIPIIRKDKDIRIALWNSANIYDSNEQNLIATIAQGIDITDRKKAEEAVLQAKLEWERTFDSVPDLIAILDKSHKIVRANKAMAHRLGIPVDQCINLYCHKCVHGDSKPPAFCPHTLTLKDGKEHVAEVYEDKLGGYFLVSTTPVFDAKGTLLGAVHVARDITERKRSEETLRESENRLKHAQEISHLGSWELDLTNNHLTWSDETYRIFGLSPQEFAATYEAFLEVVHPDDRIAVDQAYSGSLRNGAQTYEIEHRIVRKNGEIRFVHEKCEHIRNGSGQVIRSIGMIHDVTETKKAEAELVRLASFPAMNPMPIVEIDIHGKPLYQNTSSKQLFPDLEKKGFNHSFLKGIKNMVPDIEKKGSTSVVQEVNVSNRCYLQTITYIAENQRLRIYSIDITDRKKAEETLQESEEKYRRIVENTTNVIMVTQPDGIISYISPSCEDILGYSPEDLIGTSSMRFHPDDIKKVQLALSRALQGEKGQNFEYRIITKTGEVKWISHSWSPIYLDNKLHSIISVIADITELKTTESKIKKLNENLMRRSIELATANKELETFSYSVSHDLRAPLRSIDGFSQALLEDYGDILNENAKEYLLRVRKATQRMAQLIDDMLRLSRMTRVEMTIQKVDLGATAATIIDDLKKTDPQRKIKFTTDKKLMAEGDANLLHILLENLLGNAWKFTKKRPQAEIEFGKKQEGQETVFYVRDNGAGFNMKYADKLFIPFQRLHDDADYPGTGIGLGIVSRIVNRHGGRIWADAEENKGATFYFTLGGKNQ